jgi:hypothetical protein
VLEKSRGNCSAMFALTSGARIVANSERAPSSVALLLMSAATSDGAATSITFAVASVGSPRQPDNCRTTVSGSVDRIN